MRDLHECHSVVREISYKWKDLGVQLLRPDQLKELRLIELDHPRDTVECCKCIFKKWIDTTNAPWDQLISALRSPNIQEDLLATQLIEHVKSMECENLYNLLRLLESD